ncbi:hypothetical protein F7725_000820 [Dissostichus mawsoni]|uniref:Uncharacterized protein n=1 Tax=Dissostichus mawsoni TaxID=36200 RepID=A0A7J5ZFH0_DISMA|nr:hypothetical protein F7725_000820 [Dissostichus mawsoni]
MAHRRTPPPLSQRTGYLEPDNDSDRDSGVGEDAGRMLTVAMKPHLRRRRTSTYKMDWKKMEERDEILQFL